MIRNKIYWEKRDQVIFRMCLLEERTLFLWMSEGGDEKEGREAIYNKSERHEIFHRVESYLFWFNQESCVLLWEKYKKFIHAGIRESRVK